MRFQGSGIELMVKIIFLAIGIVLFIYGFFIEPDRIEISKVTIRSKKIKDALDGFSLIHLSDLHLVKMGQREAKLLKVVNDLKPDILVITGDFVNRIGAIDDCIQLINKFKARYAKFGVWGNYDYSKLDSLDRERLTTKADILILSNENRKIKVGDQNLWILGVDDLLSGYADLSKAVRQTPKEEFKILLSHSPAIFKEAKDYKVDVVLAGHTHGGQVYIPLISHLFVRLIGADRYISGLYSKDGLYLYVSRGIGTCMFPLRLFSPPEITLIRLEKEK